MQNCCTVLIFIQGYFKKRLRLSELDIPNIYCDLVLSYTHKGRMFRFFCNYIETGMYDSIVPQLLSIKKKKNNL